MNTKNVKGQTRKKSEENVTVEKENSPQDFKPKSYTTSYITVSTKSLLLGNPAFNEEDEDDDENVGNEESSAPSPTKLQEFIKYSCTQAECTKNIVIITKNKEEFVPPPVRQAASRVLKKKAFKVGSKTDDDKSVADTALQNIHFKESIYRRDDTPGSASKLFKGDKFTMFVIVENSVEVVEVKVNFCPYAIPIEVIKALITAWPFQEYLYKLSFCNGGVNVDILHNLAKNLQTSNITEVCLDGTVIPEGHYHILLSYETTIKHLSLCRCRINDMVIIDLVERLKLGGAASETLQILDLASNNIGDIGAAAIGEMLRTNRYLLHISLADNNITDTGISSIFNSLQEFKLSLVERRQLSARKINFIRSKYKVFQKCLKEELRHAKAYNVPGNERGSADVDKDKEKEKEKDKENKKSGKKGGSEMSSKTTKSKKASVSVAVLQTLNFEDIAQKRADQICGVEFCDIFDQKNTCYRDHQITCMGNFKLCSLNISYNDLNIFAVEKLRDVLGYQKTVTDAGLTRVNIDGNNIPKNISAIQDIDIYLHRKFNDSSSNLKGAVKRRQSKLSGKTNSAVSKIS